MLKGLCGSGKSTYARELVEKGWVRVNKDDLRAMMHNSQHSKANESCALAVRDFILGMNLVAKKNVVIDDTNFNPVHETTLRKLARDYGADFEVKFFDVDVEECIARDAKRPKSVGEKVIRDMYNQYLLKEKVQQYTPDPLLPSAYIFDIDGTLALMNGRSPYDYTKVDTDKVNTNVLVTAQLLAGTGTEIVIVSGRDGSCKDATMKWLDDNDVPYRNLFMRTAGDTRKDDLIKKEIFFSEIAPKWNVIGVFDDRNRVVDMWREIGLTCFQVQEGDF